MPGVMFVTQATFTNNLRRIIDRTQNGRGDRKQRRRRREGGAATGDLEEGERVGW